MIIRFPGHRLCGTRLAPCRCQTRGDGTSCLICDGGLALCVVCGGAESSMPTDCPGCIMEDVVQEAVQVGECDYDARRGWVQRDAAREAMRRSILKQGRGA